MNKRGNISTSEQVLPFLRPLVQKTAYNELLRRHSEEDVEWFVGHPDSPLAHPKGYERGPLTPSHHAVITQRWLGGENEALARGTIVAYRSLIVPADKSEKGLEAFVKGKLTGDLPELQQYAHVLINEPQGIMRRQSVEQTVMLKTEATGLNLASRAIHQCLNGTFLEEIVDDRHVPRIRAAYEHVRDRLQIIQAINEPRY